MLITPTAAHRPAAPSPPRPRPSPATPGACARPAPGGPRNCGSTCWRSAGRGVSLSGFIPRHIEQHGSRHSNPASSRTRSSPSCFRLLLHQARPGHHQRLHAGGHLAALGDGGGGADVLDAAVGAGADEHHVDRHVRQLLAGRQRHVFQHALHLRALAFVRLRRRDRAPTPVTGTTAPGLVPQVTIGAMSRGVQRHGGVVVRAGIGRQRPPIGHAPAPTPRPSARIRGP